MKAIERRLTKLEEEAVPSVKKWRVVCFEDLQAWQAAGCPGDADLSEAPDEFLRELITSLEDEANKKT